MDFGLPVWEEQSAPDRQIYRGGERLRASGVGGDQRETEKIPYLVSTNFLLPALEVVKFYSHRWKIEQMIKDLKQQLASGDYQVRNLQAIRRYAPLVLLSYFPLILLKILKWLNN